MKLIALTTVCVLAACTPSAASSTAAEIDYTARLTRCVDKSETLAESKACRAAVDAELGVNKKDGGK